MNRKITLRILLAVVLMCGSVVASAQSAAEAEAEALRQANNPLASVKSLNLHNYYTSSLYGIPDATTNLTWLRYAQPFGNFILRASLPVMTVSLPGEGPQSGLYDANMFLIYKFRMRNPGTDLGIGPAATFPTATNDLGSGKWQVGVSAIAFFKGNPVIQMGTLLTWQMSVAGKDDKPDVNLLTPQIFAMWQIGGGTYLRSTGIWSFNLENGQYNVPIGLGIGKAFKSGGKIFNVFMEPQYSVYSWGAGQPKVQVFVGFNTQFH